MSPELGMHNAMFEVLILPPLVFILTIVAGVFFSFFLSRRYGDSASVKNNVGLLGIATAVSFVMTAAMLWTAPPFGALFPFPAYAVLFLCCALVPFWNEVRRRNTAK